MTAHALSSRNISIHRLHLLIEADTPWYYKAYNATKISKDPNASALSKYGIAGVNLGTLGAGAAAGAAAGAGIYGAGAALPGLAVQAASRLPAVLNTGRTIAQGALRLGGRIKGHLPAVLNTGRNIARGALKLGSKAKNVIGRAWNYGNSSGTLGGSIKNWAARKAIKGAAGAGIGAGIGSLTGIGAGPGAALGLSVGTLGLGGTNRLAGAYAGYKAADAAGGGWKAKLAATAGGGMLGATGVAGLAAKALPMVGQIAGTAIQGLGSLVGSVRNSYREDPADAAKRAQQVASSREKTQSDIARKKERIAQAAEQRTQAEYQRKAALAAERVAASKEREQRASLAAREDITMANNHILDFEPFAKIAYRLTEQLLGPKMRHFPRRPEGRSALVRPMDEATAHLLKDFDRLVGDDLPRNAPVYREDIDALVIVGLFAEMADLTFDQFMSLSKKVISEAVQHSMPILIDLQEEDIPEILPSLRAGGNSLRDQVLTLANNPEAIKAAHSAAQYLGELKMGLLGRVGWKMAKVGAGGELGGYAADKMLGPTMPTVMGMDVVPGSPKLVGRRVGQLVGAGLGGTAARFGASGVPQALLLRHALGLAAKTSFMP